MGRRGLPNAEAFRPIADRNCGFSMLALLEMPLNAPALALMAWKTLGSAEIALIATPSLASP